MIQEVFVKLRWVILGVFAALLFTADSQAAEKVLLRHKFEKGGTCRLKDTFETAAGFKVPQMGDFRAMVKVGRTWKDTVKSVRGKTLIQGTCQGKLEAVRFTMRIPERGSVDFDSESPNARREASLDPVAGGLYRLKGRKFQYTVDGTGKVGKVSGMAKTVKSLFSRLKSKEAVTVGAAKTCEAQFGDKGLAAALRDYYIPLPKKEALPRDK